MEPRNFKKKVATAEANPRAHLQDNIFEEKKLQTQHNLTWSPEVLRPRTLTRRRNRCSPKEQAITVDAGGDGQQMKVVSYCDSFSVYADSEEASQADPVQLQQGCCHGQHYDQQAWSRQVHAPRRGAAE